MIEPFKYIIQPVALERDENGRAVAEKPAQVMTVFNAAEAVKLIEEFEAAVLAHGGEANGSVRGNDSNDNLRQPDLSRASRAG